MSRFKADFGGRPVDTIGAQELADWLFGTRGNGDALSTQTVSNRRAILHGFFTWLLQQKKIDYNPVTAIAKPRVVLVSALDRGGIKSLARPIKIGEPGLPDSWVIA